MRSKTGKIFLIAPLALLAVLLFVAIGGIVVMLLWNWLAPNLFGLRLVSFWEALGILVLCRILFGGFGMHGCHRRRTNRDLRERIVDRVADRVGERFDDMTPEEQQRFQQRMRERWGNGPTKGETQPL